MIQEKYPCPEGQEVSFIWRGWGAQPGAWWVPGRHLSNGASCFVLRRQSPRGVMGVVTGSFPRPTRPLGCLPHLPAPEHVVSLCPEKGSQHDPVPVALHLLPGPPRATSGSPPPARPHPRASAPRQRALLGSHRAHLLLGLRGSGLPPSPTLGAPPGKFSAASSVPPARASCPPLPASAAHRLCLAASSSCPGSNQRTSILPEGQDRLEALQDSLRSDRAAAWLGGVLRLLQGLGSGATRVAAARAPRGCGNQAPRPGGGGARYPLRLWRWFNVGLTRLRWGGRPEALGGNLFL